MATVDSAPPVGEIGDTKNEKIGSSNDSVSGAEHGTAVPVVSAEVEAALIRKLDRRIIPVCCWIYLMNFMDRGQ